MNEVSKMNKFIIICLTALLTFCPSPKKTDPVKNALPLLLLTSSPATSSSNLEQYTPNQSNWKTFETKPIAAGNTAHDPDSVTWITKAQWEASKWDGKTIYDPTKMTGAQFFAAICPSADRVRGIREVFYQHNPFKDNKNPTKAEVDEWHRIAINHVRALVGYTSADRQSKKTIVCLSEPYGEMKDSRQLCGMLNTLEQMARQRVLAKVPVMLIVVPVLFQVLLTKRLTSMDKRKLARLVLVQRE